MTIEDLQRDGPPVTPADLAGALGCSVRYIQKLLDNGVLVGFQLLSAGEKRKRKRWRIPREAARALLVPANVAHGAHGANRSG